MGYNPQIKGLKMEKKIISNIWDAYKSVISEKKKMDPVDKDEAEKDYEDLEDKDLDNDGDEDESDSYLANRRKTITKKTSKSDEKEVEMEESMAPKLKADSFKTIRVQDRKNVPPTKKMNSTQKSLSDIRNRAEKKANESYDVHTKGAMKSEKMKDSFTASDLKFLDAHGVDLTGQDSGIDGAKAAADTVTSIKNSTKAKAPGRPGDKR
jgi:hypothetical protein